METSTLLAAAPFITGILSHLLYFHKGEHHLYGKFYLELFLTTLISIPLLLISLETQSSRTVITATAACPSLFLTAVKTGLPLPTALSTATCGFIFPILRGANWSPVLTTTLHIASQYLLGLYTSLLTYRLFLNPLNTFPGPYFARLSTFHLTYHLRHRTGYINFLNWHKKYGHFVRIGPNTISTVSPGAVQLVHGPGSKCTKPPFYDFGQPMVSLQTYRSKADHDARRRVWSSAFSDKSLRGYETRLQSYRRVLLRNIASQNGQPIHVNKWFHSYSFDVMGDLAFGKSYGLLENGEHWAISMIQKGLEPLGYMLPDWLFRLLTQMPVVSRGWWKFLDFTVQCMDERLKLGDAEIPDITSALMVPLQGKLPTGADWDVLRGDSQLIVSAGSDTTANTLAAIIYQLCLHPTYIPLLRSELSTTQISPRDEIPNDKIAHLPLLNAVITETLRLHPAVPIAIARETPVEGLVIDGTYIPGKTQILCPQYVLSRQDELYERPNEFIPERWVTSPELVKDKRSYTPFSIGPYNCIGKPLALLNLRTTLSRLIMTFDIKFAPGEDGSKFEAESKEQFGHQFGKLMVSFKERE